MDAEKKIVSGTEYELVVGIPPVRRFRIVRVEPEVGTIPVQVEHVRVAIAVGYVCGAIRATAREIVSALYFMRDRKSPSTTYQVFSFLDKMQTTPREALTARALNLHSSEWFQKASFSRMTYWVNRLI